MEAISGECPRSPKRDIIRHRAYPVDLQIHCKRSDHIEAREARLKAKAAREKREAKVNIERELSEGCSSSRAGCQGK